MRAWCIAGLLVVQLVLPSAAIARDKKVKDLPPYEFYPVSFPMGDARIPECAPLRPKPHPGFDEVVLEDPNGSWYSLSVDKRSWEGLSKFSNMEECLETVERYRGRYAREDIDRLRKGHLTAGMPFEFALMILGPTDRPPSYVSTLNLVSGRPEEFRSYTWIKPPDKVGLGIFFSALSTLALGAAATTDNFSAMSRYLDVATIATVAEFVAWESVFSQAQVVTVQVSKSDTITMLVAQ